MKGTSRNLSFHRSNLVLIFDLLQNFDTSIFHDSVYAFVYINGNFPRLIPNALSVHLTIKRNLDFDSSGQLSTNSYKRLEYTL